MINMEELIIKLYKQELKVDKDLFDEILYNYQESVMVDDENDHFFYLDYYANNIIEFYVNTGFEDIILRLTMYQEDIRNYNKEIEDASCFKYYIKIHGLSAQQDFYILSLKEKRDLESMLIKRCNNLSEDKIIETANGSTYDEIVESLYKQHKEAVNKRKRL